jgi:hypothetical protein
MHIELNPEQYRTLLELVHAGSFMFSAARGSDEESEDERADLESYLLSHAADFDCSDLVQPGIERNGSFASSDLEEAVNEVIDAYDEDVFWGELTERLAERDFLREYGDAAVARMNATERYELSLPYYDLYEEVFEKTGTDTLLVKKENQDVPCA